jgi:hypothetical protein
VVSGKATVVVQSVAVAQGDLVSIGGNVTVIGNVTIAGNLTVPRGGVLNVQGALEVLGNLDVGEGGTVVVNGVLVLTGASLSVAVTSTAPSVSVVVAQFDAVQGTAGTLSAVVAPGCTLASVMQSQTLSALTVTVNQDCGGSGAGGLPLGAITGIAVGGFAVVVLVFAFVLGIRAYKNKAATREAFQRYKNVTAAGGTEMAYTAY